VSKMLEQEAQADLLSDKYDVCIKTLDLMGFTEDDGVPTYAEVVGSITRAADTFLARREERDIQDELVIVPSLQQIGLVGSRRRPGLLKRYDSIQDQSQQTFIADDPWYKYADTSPLHDNNPRPEKWHIGFLLNDTSNPLKRDVPITAEPGLVHTNQTTVDQRRAVIKENRTESRRIATRGVNIGFAAVSHLVVINAMHQVQGLSPLDSTGESYTRLPHYLYLPQKPTTDSFGITKPPTVPLVCANPNGQMQLLSSELDKTNAAYGIRRVLRLSGVIQQAA